MSTVEEVKAALAKLTLEERAEILSELCGWTDDDWDWDRQMKADAAAGNFTSLNREADTAHAAGQTRPLDDILREP
jgi:hypothetical protein